MDYVDFIILVFLIYISALPQVVSQIWDAIYGYFTSPIFIKRAKKFKTLKRGYYSFQLILVLYVLSFFLPFIVSDKALMVKYNGEVSFPAIYDAPIPFKSYLPFMKAKAHLKSDYGLDGFGLVNFRELKTKFETEGKDNYVIMPIYPYSPMESTTIMAEYPDQEPPIAPDSIHILGTDDRGRDVFARLTYGFNISMTFALLVTLLSYIVGVSIGGYLGYFGGAFDIIVQRLVEIWTAVPFLYAIMIVVSILKPSMYLLVLMLATFGWMGMTFYIRGEFLREKAKDYVSAAISIGVRDNAIIFRHILPNSLTPVISFLPFAIVGNISALVSLDFLGFGLAPPTPSWGELMSQGTAHLTSPWLVFTPITALFITLMLVTFIGEAVREAFDPKQFSRLR